MNKTILYLKILRKLMAFTIGLIGIFFYQIHLKDTQTAIYYVVVSIWVGAD